MPIVPGEIPIERRRVRVPIGVAWPMSAAGQCAVWWRVAAAEIRIKAVRLALERLDMTSGPTQLDTISGSGACRDERLARKSSPRLPLYEPTWQSPQDPRLR